MSGRSTSVARTAERSAARLRSARSTSSPRYPTLSSARRARPSLGPRTSSADWASSSACARGAVTVPSRSTTMVSANLARSVRVWAAADAHPPERLQLLSCGASTTRIRTTRSNGALRDLLGHQINIHALSFSSPNFGCWLGRMTACCAARERAMGKMSVIARQLSLTWSRASKGGRCERPGGHE